MFLPVGLHVVWDDYDDALLVACYHPEVICEDASFLFLGDGHQPFAGDITLQVVFFGPLVEDSVGILAGPGVVVCEDDHADVFHGGVGGLDAGVCGGQFVGGAAGVSENADERRGEKDWGEPFHC
mgnify:CR=1 FL=1